jgi:hypothetical protein
MDRLLDYYEGTIEQRREKYSKSFDDYLRLIYVDIRRSRRP